MAQVFKKLGRKYLAAPASLLGVMALVLVSLTPAFTGDQPPCPRDAFQKILADIAYRDDSHRFDEGGLKNIWRDYKNGPNLDPIKVDLSDACLAEACPQLARDHPPAAGMVGGHPTRYESTVLSLKRGDTVVFDGVEYRLGLFLGAGNTTHVFSIEGTRMVLRLSFLSDFIWEKLKRRYPMTQHERLNYIRARTKSTAQALRTKKGAVKIYKTDPDGRFMVAHKVHGTFSGAKLLGNLITFKGKVSGDTPLFYPSYEHMLDQQLMTPLERQQLSQLLDLMIQNGEATLDKDTGIIQFYAIHSRQYIWDAYDSQWYVVDAD